MSMKFVMTTSGVASSSAACQMPEWAPDSSQNTACRVLKWTKSTTEYLLSTGAGCCQVTVSYSTYY